MFEKFKKEKAYISANASQYIIISLCHPLYLSFAVTEMHLRSVV